VVAGSICGWVIGLLSSLVSSLVLIPLITWIGGGLSAPLFPETTRLVSQMGASDIWSRYVRYIGAGAVAVAGLLTVLKNLPTMGGAFVGVVRSFSRKRRTEVASFDSTDRDLPGTFVVGAILFVIAVAAFVPGVFAGGMGPLPRAVCAAGVALFGLLFVTVAARIVGIVGVSSQPTSGITLVTLLGVASIFAAAGWIEPSARAAVLTVGTIVAVAASKAGDISQDLKTGYLVGATPARQQLGQLIGAAFACWAVAGTVLMLGRAYTFGSPELPAPQATLMKTVIEGVLAGALPWGLVGTGASFALSAMLAGLPGLAFAVGIYLPLASLTPIFVGGLVRRMVDSRRTGAAPDTDPGVLASSGMIAGEGLAGVAIAFLVAARTRWPESGWSLALGRLHFADRAFTYLSGVPAAVFGLIVLSLLAALLYRAGRRAAA